MGAGRGGRGALEAAKDQRHAVEGLAELGGQREDGPAGHGEPRRRRKPTRLGVRVLAAELSTQPKSYTYIYS